MSATLEEGFRAAFGGAPAAISRAPGRVNLIGEHVDYHGLPVLPMALTRSVRVAFRPRADGLVRLANADPRFAPAHLELRASPGQGAAGSMAPQGSWTNYVAAAARVALDLGARHGLEGFVRSDVPPAAGLSSSSALVVAVAQALLAASAIIVEPRTLAEALAAGERLVGTEGGGMDQAVSLGAVAGAALLVRFDPLDWRHLPLPADWCVVVAHSGIEAEKSGNARDAYNQRRREGLEGLHVLMPGATFGQALRDEGAERLLAHAHERLAGLRLGRFRHVVTEADRVEGAVRCLEAGDLQGFGACMTASHASLRDDYDVSHPRLDRLVQVALDAGAAGARLTGAGFGGCMIALADASRVSSVRDALDRALGGEGIPTDERTLFVAKPGGGARVETHAD